MKSVFVPVGIFFLLFSVNGFGQSFRARHTSDRQAINLLYDEDEEEEEDSIRGFGFGINLGSYFGNKGTANFYNGSGPIDGYINEALGSRLFSLEERIDPNTGFGSQFYYDVNAIKTMATQSPYNSPDGNYTFPYDTHPTNMRYNPSFCVGIQVKYNFNRYSALIFNSNFIKLKTVSQFTLQFVGTNQTGSLTNVHPFTIAGDEQRFNFNLGYRQGWMMGDFSNLYLQFGGSMLGTKFVDNYLTVVPGTELQLLTQSLVVGQVAQSTQGQTGIGFGAYASVGLEFWLGRYSFDLSLGFSRDKVVLYSYEKTVMNKWIMATFAI